MQQCKCNVPKSNYGLYNHSMRHYFCIIVFSNYCCSSLSFVNFILQESGGRIDKVGKTLLEQLDDLLKLEMNDQLMKTIVQLVKVSSSFHHYSRESVKTQIMSLVELRKNGWGVTPRVSGAASDAVPSSSSLSVPSSEADVIVGEDGVALELNEEERSFLESQFNCVMCLGLDDPEQDQSFDEQEVLKDFGAFVKEEEDRKTTSMLEKLEVCDRDN
uniref:MIF4G domain-containing protein n=1 Tax=Angiostrongylus cantonensis TaxID=6313 RepID=A0A0K0DIW5_ANGCA